ncbi:MAG: hypothetical protein ACK5QT_06440 [Oligoflexia bacterium]
MKNIPYYSSLLLLSFLSLYSSPALASEIQNCSPPQERTLLQLEGRLRDRLAALNRELPTLLASQNSTRLNYLVYQRALLQAFATLEKTAASGLSLRCHTARGEKICQVPGNQAFVRFFLGFSGSTLHFCPSFFALPGQDEQLEIVLHELSHSALSTDDLALSWITKDSADLTQAARDAYHLQSFATLEAEQVLKTQIWPWLKARSH